MCEEKNLFIHSVTVLSILVYIGVSSNSESFYTAFLTVYLNLAKKENCCAGLLGFLCGLNWNQSDPNICFVGKTFPLPLRGKKNAAAFRD